MYNALLKASIASATNAHRLGANEAPPAIISTFLGTQISDILDKFENSSIEDAIEVDDKKGLHLGFGQIPELLLDNTDRNRTSPFAFTGNRFEFRAPGSSGLTVKWTKVSGAKGYEVSVSTNKKFTSGTTKKGNVTSGSKISGTFKNLKKGTKYYVRVRAYKTDALGNKIYGSYSAVKSIKVK